MERDKISIIVPVYNVEKYLARCVESLLQQSYQNLEILLVDDGSTDRSGGFCDMYARENERVRTFHKENGGLISTWKYGVEKASGEYVFFVDSDDWIEEGTIQEMAVFLTGGKKEIVACDYVIEREGKKQEYVYQKLEPGEYVGKKLQQEAILKLLGYEERYVTISRCMKLISRELILQNMHYCDPIIRTAEDTMIMFPSIADCERLVILDHKAYYHYRYVKSSMIHRYDKGLYENICLLRRILQQIIADKFDGEERALMELQEKKEFLYLMLLVLKNEARGNPQGYRRNIKQICKSPEIRHLVRQVPISTAILSNKLLYAVLRFPSDGMIGLLRLAMRWYYRR